MKKEWKLSSFDLFTLGMTIKGAWIYQVAPDAAKMRVALRKLAQTYPLLGGRYSEKTKSVLWEAGQVDDLPFTTCDLKKYSVQDLVGNTKVWSLVKAYDINAFKKGEIAPFSAVLAYLKDGAVLYVQCAHAVMDGSSFYRMVGQWASLYKGEEISVMTVDQSLIPAPDALSEEETLRQVQENGWIKVKAGQLIKMLWNLVRNNRIKTTCEIEVSQEEIKALRESSGAGTNAVLAAIATKAFAAKLGKESLFTFLFVADLRGRFTGIDDSFFGNISQPVVAGDGFDPKEDTAVLASRIDSSLKAVIASGRHEENVRLSQCSSHYSLPYTYFDASDMNSSDPGTIYFNNQLKFRACELDWGTGMPVYAFPNELVDMVKFWQPVAGGPVHIIFGGLASKIMSR